MIHPSKKRSANEVLESDLTQEQLQNLDPLICQVGFGNCTRCVRELSYYSCNFCFLCCYTYFRGFYSCNTVCDLFSLFPFTFTLTISLHHWFSLTSSTLSCCLDLLLIFLYSALKELVFIAEIPSTI